MGSFERRIMIMTMAVVTISAIIIINSSGNIENWTAFEAVVAPFSATSLSRI